jgi:hypothetical protein
MRLARLSPKLFLLLFVVAYAGAFAQAIKPVEELGYTVVNHDRVRWPSPESALKDLRSPDDETRLNALKLAGLSDQQAHEAAWSSGHDSPVKASASMS